MYIRLFHQNIQHLKSRIESLLIVLDDLKPQIIVLTEHDVKEHEIERLNIETFLINSFFSRKNTNKGGVMILSNNKINYKPIKLPKPLNDQLLEEKQFEFCLAMFTLKNFKFIVIGLYRSPSACSETFCDRLGILVDYLSKKCDKIICAGDVNIDVLVNDKDCKLLKNALKGLNMKYLVDFPTRITEDSETGIDNIFVKNIPSKHLSINGVITLLSDHDGQTLDIKLPREGSHIKNNVTLESRIFTQEGFLTLSKLLERETWMDVYLSPVEEKYNNFFVKLIYYFNLIFPKKVIKSIKKKNGWISKELREAKSNLIRLKKEIRKSKNPIKKELLKEQISKFRLDLNSAKNSFYKNKIEKSPNIPKTVWEIINSEVGENNCKKQQNTTIIEGGRAHSDPKITSEIFNDYFVNIVEDISTNNQTEEQCLQKIRATFNNNNNSNDNLFSNRIFHLKPTHKEEVEKVITSLKNKRSCGFDDIPVSLLKSIKTQISPVITHLINSSFVAGYFPDKLKISKVVPVFKKDDPSKVLNYRPVSLLPTISKIFEKIVHNQLVAFLINYKLFDNIQHGFRVGRSVVTASVSFIESIIESVDRGEETVGIFMDLSKAFDSVKHKILIEKLKLLGIVNNSLDWFKSYLNNRYQYVEISYVSEQHRLMKVSSQQKLIKYGVPQGSILGPLLFLCYIKNIGETFSQIPRENLCLYADDANLKISANSVDQIEVLSYVELSHISQYFVNHNLNLNSGKTNFINFKTFQNKKLHQPNIAIDCTPLEIKSKANFLGLIIDENLQWNDHVDKIIPKINSGIYALKKMSFLCDTITLRTIYFAYIHSHIQYGLCLYGSTKNTNLDQILKLQKKSIRIISKLKSNESAREYFKRLKIITVYGQYIYDTIVLYRNQSHFAFKNVAAHKYNTRYRSQIIPNHHRLEFYTKKPSYMGQKFFKHIPKSIQSEQSNEVFKRKLKELLTEKVIYSICEFYN